VISSLTAALASARRVIARRAEALLRTLVRERRVQAVAAAVVAFAFFVVLTVAPTNSQSDAQALEDYVNANAQTVTVPDDAQVAELADRGDYDVSPGVDTLKKEGTNYAWAKMVMLFGGWPMSDDNITVFTRWMRQENGPPDWFNRNNPLNNGWGTQGGTFMSGYANLVDAARQCADALNTNPGYAGIRDGFAEAKPAKEIEAAIWASPWATGHYNNGAHWSYTEVQKVEAPKSAWG